MNQYVLGASLAVAVVMTAAADEGLKSGPQKPSVSIRPFDVLHCSGPQIGTKNCLV